MPSKPSALPSPHGVLVLGHHDADGIISAALAGAFLRDHLPETPLHFGSVDFHLADRWSDIWTRIASPDFDWIPPGTRVPNGLALVDFPPTEIPEDVWFLYADHHESAFRSCGATDTLKKHYMARAHRGEPIFYEPGAASCVNVLIRNLAAYNHWSPPASLREGIDLAHRIDQAAYVSASEAIDYAGSRMARLDALALTLTEREAAESMRLLAYGADMDAALFELHQHRVNALIANVDAALGIRDEILIPLNPFAVLIDWTHPKANDLVPVRFLEYHATGASYAARLQAKQDEDGWVVSVSLGRSPWISPPVDGLAHPHMARIAEAVGGGGHAYAAGFRVRSTSLEDARSRAKHILGGLSSCLCRLERGHPLSEDQV